MKIVAIDPGECTGWAMWETDTGLTKCGVGSGALLRYLPIATYAKGAIVVELPQVYPHSKVDPNDLITLAVRLGRVAERCAIRTWPTLCVHPRVWKGQTPKAAHNAQVLSALDAKSLAVARMCLENVTKSLKNNAVDAIGLAVWFAAEVKSSTPRYFDLADAK